MHATLIEVTSREQLLRIQHLTSKYVDTIYFPFSLRTRLDGSFPESPVRVFAYPTVNSPKYLFMYKENVYIKPTICIAQIPGTTIDRWEVIECLREFRARTSSGAKSQPHLVIGKEYLVKMYSVLMRIDSCNWESKELNLSLFYMTEQQQKQALRTPLPKLVKGYYFDELDATEEGELVNGTWKHAGPGDLEQTIAKISRLPSSCIRFEGSPVAFEMTDPCGFFNNQFVFPDHRRKGLGNGLEIDLIQKSIRNGHAPFKTVTKDNVIVLTASSNSPLWTQWTTEDGVAETVVFQEWKLT